MKCVVLIAIGVSMFQGAPLPAMQASKAIQNYEEQPVDISVQPHELLLNARRMLENGKPGKSIGVCKLIARKFPQSNEAPLALEMCGKSYMRQHQFQLAFKALQGLLEKHPNCSNFESAIVLEFELAKRLAAGERNYFWGKIPGLRDREFAIRVFQHIADNAPYSPQATQALLQIADLGVKTKEPAVAVGALERLIDEYSDTGDAQRAYLLLAQIYSKISKGPAYDQRAVENAINCFREFLLLYGDSPFVEEAEQELVEMKNLLAASKLNIGDFYLQDRRSPNAAAIYYKDILVSAPNSPAALCAQTRLGAIREMDSNEHGPAT
ncbi:MAG: outer membrane protein assembly factor BamD [Puniceicoccales bacterium]|nr:outer membrane protein assembly factor BamD [Puniceicoccales bacterium]